MKLAIYYPTEEENTLCINMARLGYSNRAINKVLGFSDYQIAIRLRAVGLKRKHYRDMETPVAKAIVKKLSLVSQQRLVRHLEKYLLK